MGREGIMLGEMSQRKINTVWPHLYVESKRQKTPNSSEEEVRPMGTRDMGGTRGNWRQVAKRYKLPATKSRRTREEASDMIGVTM